MLNATYAAALQPTPATIVWRTTMFTVLEFAIYVLTPFLHVLFAIPTTTEPWCALPVPQLTTLTLQLPVLYVLHQMLTATTVILEEQDQCGVTTALRPTTSPITLLVLAVYVMWVLLTVPYVLKIAVNLIISVVMDVWMENITQSTKPNVLFVVMQLLTAITALTL